MQSATRIDGVWRNTNNVHTTINGVTRESDAYARIDGIWRSQHDAFVDLSDLIGFRIVYTWDDSATYPEFPWLQPNRELPVYMHETGDHPHQMDTSMKGVILEYDRSLPYNEGIARYRATMYAEFPNDRLIAINPNPNEVERWTSFQLANLNIQIQRYEAYVKYGFYVSGWNTIFHSYHFMDTEEYPEQGPEHKNRNLDERSDILPEEVRMDSFGPDILIGIARNLRTPDRNMVGSYGSLDHTYKEILVNGNLMPFTVEVYH